MKNEVDEVQPSVESRYDYIVMDSERMADFMAKSNDFEKIAMYRNSLNRLRELRNSGVSDTNEQLKIYWFSTLELEQTDAIRKYNSGEITSEMVEQHEQEQQALIEEIMERFAQRRREKKSMKYQLKKFLGINNSRKR